MFRETWCLGLLDFDTCTYVFAIWFLLAAFLLVVPKITNAIAIMVNWNYGKDSMNTMLSVAQWMEKD